MGTETLEGFAMMNRSTCLGWLALGAMLGWPVVLHAVAEESSSRDRLILVTGAAGDDEYVAEFEHWANGWKTLAERQGWVLTEIGGSQADSTPDESASDFEILRQAIEEHRGAQPRLWIVLLGHGTYARNAAKFNLVGQDVAATDLKQWLANVNSDLVIINCSSASAPFLSELAGRNRVIITATRSGSEINFARFGRYLSEAINDPASDIDHDNEVSLLEAFLAATSKTERFYREDARLTTEHALLDDNGDRIGTSGDFYRGIRPVKEGAAGKSIDGSIAKGIIVYSSPDAPRLSGELEQQRAEIEMAVDQLRLRKNQYQLTEYYDHLEELMLELAAIYARAEQ
jgi:hypothetical protein